MGLLILDGVNGTPERRGKTYEEFVQRVYRNRAARLGVRLPPLTFVVEQEPLTAVVNANRWIVNCPDCRGAEYAWRDGPFLFMCCSCFNGVVDHMWRPYVFPVNRQDIENVLMARPDPETRNWLVEEAIEQLKIENLTHGYGLGAG